jgi:hypothetical protein
MAGPARTKFHSARATTARAGSITAAGVSGTSPGPLSTPSRNSHSEGTSTSHRPKKQAMARGGIWLRAASAQPASTATPKAAGDGADHARGDPGGGQHQRRDHQPAPDGQEGPERPGVVAPGGAR